MRRIVLVALLLAGCGGTAKLESFVVRDRVALVCLRAPRPTPRREFHPSAQPWRKPLDRKLFAGWSGARS